MFVKQENITQTIADYLARTRFEDLPREAVESTKTHILHTLGTIVAGSRAPGIQKVLNCVNDWGVKEESTVLVYGNKLPAASAALVNATMGHSYHVDMKDDRRSYPTAVSAIPAALAVAEKLGTVSGKELITAVCLGIEMGIRVSLSIKPLQQAFVQSLGPLAAATSCGKLLKLDANGMYNTVVIACRRAAVPGITLGEAALNETVGAGFPSQSGVQSALLAAQGFPLTGDFFQGLRNFFQGLYKEDGDLDVLLSDLGRRYEILGSGPKPYPCHRGNHPGITAVLNILQKTKLDPEQISEVTIYVEKRRMGTFEKNKQNRYRPPDLAEVQHAYPFLVAVALLKGKITLADVTEDAIRDERVLKFAERIKLVYDPKLELDQWPMVVKPHVVEVHMRDGRVYSERVEYPKGDPENPFTPDEEEMYFRDLTSFSAKPLGTEKIEKVISLIATMEDVQDAASVCRLLT